MTVPTVVGLGSSAGGLAALTAFFGALDPTVEAAFVVVPHLAAEHPSGVASVITRHTGLAVRSIEDGVTLAPATVYVLPPGAVVRLEGDRLRLRPDGDGPLARPIDRFFSSLAAERGAGAVGVVLSGAGNDGSRGVRAIDRAGGLVFVQSPDDARFDGMPQSAIATGVVDRIAPAAALGRDLATCVAERTPAADTPPGDPAVAPPVIDDATLTALVARLGAAGAVDYGAYSLAAVREAVQRRLAAGVAGDPTEGPGRDLLALFDGPGELDALRRALVDAPRRFDDDPHLFDVLETTLLPRRVAEVGDRPLRLWCIGCGTGESAYSLAMCLFDALAHRRRSAAAPRIFATDADPAALAIAGRGQYAAAALDAVGPDRLARHFVAHDGAYRVARRLRAAVVFARHDVFTEPAFAELDLIDCRGVLPALRPAARDRLVARMHHALAPGGLVVTGPHDVLDPAAFALADSRARVYRRLEPDAAHARRLADDRRDDPPLPDDPAALRACIDALRAANEALAADNVELRALNAAQSAPETTQSARDPERHAGVFRRA
ncbi:MAG: hypothetical protein H6705_20940 [Myxococcales bacterium]|nr:hypothetical protein [Myxococcales bacterium]